MTENETRIHFRGNEDEQLRHAVVRGREVSPEDIELLLKKKIKRQKTEAPTTAPSETGCIDPWTVDGLAEAADLIVRVLGGGVSVVIKGSQETVTAGESGQTLNRATIKIEGLKQNGESE
jgi:hypothetical protein